MLLCFLLLGPGEAAPPDLSADPLRLRFKQHTRAPADSQRSAQAHWDIDHYDLGIVLNAEEQVVEGDITISATALGDDPDPLLLHADGPDISSITIGDATATWDEDEDEVRVDAPRGTGAGDQISVRVRYRATPNESPGLGLNWSQLVWSFHEPSGAQEWLVVFDDPSDKATATWTVRARSEWTVVANGSTDGPEAHDDGTSTWVYDFEWPIATYLLVLNAGPFQTHEDLSGTWPVYTHATAGAYDQAVLDFANTGEMMDHMSDLWVEYPWSHYANVLVPMGGAMEHTTATSFGWDLLGSSYAEYVNAHELAHHWWGDYVTCAEWEEIWLNEGFASYGEVIWAERQGGLEWRRAYLEYQRESYFAWQEWEGESTLYDPLYMWGGLVYDKGSLVLHMLRYTMGDEAFFEGLAHYADTMAHDVATTSDLQTALEDVHGEDLSWFFDGWVYQAGDPSFTYGLTQTERADGTWQVDVHLAQDTDQTWTTPLDVVITLENGDIIDDRAWARGALEVTSWCTESPAEALSVDPEGHILYVSLDEAAGFEAAPDACSAPVTEDTADPDIDGDLDESAAGGRELSACACAAGPRGLPWLLGLAPLLVLRRTTPRPVPVPDAHARCLAERA